MKALSKIWIVVVIGVISGAASAGHCKLCNAQIMGNKAEFCSRCKFTPEAKRMKKKAAERDLAKKQTQEKLDLQKNR